MVVGWAFRHPCEVSVKDLSCFHKGLVGVPVKCEFKVGVLVKCVCRVSGGAHKCLCSVY